MNTVTVYCASSSKVDISYINAAKELGFLLANRKITCINGAGGKGLMAAVSDAVLSKGGYVIGVIPQFMIDEGWYHKNLSEMIITQTMHERKQMMADKSDGCICLPGGVGTMEELLEVITWKQLGLYSKPIVLLNTNNYYNRLLDMLEKAVEENFVRSEHKNIFRVAKTPEEVLSFLELKEVWHENPRSIAAI